ncbi:hypothetical protein HNQ80_001034 [Anaerosolibacter carboniphilus]|uniref:Uncharacterized protein n=1 Tax=Anaerosolibacter carboniphilus TaxID=1417629 RepID=A0A841KXQ1_9FIRM|nr:hypothetical protein [Anaerosolibacter carboniphilus]MBB6214949.1 hypothetical protein [Anaerosolibacter carboniphilus]
MIKLEITKEVNSSKLMDELLAQGLINPLCEDGTSTIRDNSVFIDDEENIEAVQQIIDAHDPTPLPQPLSEIEQLKLEKNILAQSIYDLTTIIEAILLGGIE